LGARGVNSNLVRFVCRTRVHVDASRTLTEDVGSPVTIHDGAWAYCPGGAHTEHEWKAIEPVTLADLRLVEVVRPREAAPEDE
jgi:hypothetical protein